MTGIWGLLTIAVVLGNLLVFTIRRKYPGRYIQENAPKKQEADDGQLQKGRLEESYAGQYKNKKPNRSCSLINATVQFYDSSRMMVIHCAVQNETDTFRCYAIPYYKLQDCQRIELPLSEEEQSKYRFNDCVLRIDLRDDCFPRIYLEVVDRDDFISKEERTKRLQKAARIRRLIRDAMEKEAQNGSGPIPETDENDRPSINRYPTKKENSVLVVKNYRVIRNCHAEFLEKESMLLVYNQVNSDTELFYSFGISYQNLIRCDLIQENENRFVSNSIVMRLYLTHGVVDRLDVPIVFAKDGLSKEEMGEVYEAIENIQQQIQRIINLQRLNLT